jgi:hypothetical protein
LSANVFRVVVAVLLVGVVVLAVGVVVTYATRTQRTICTAVTGGGTVIVFPGAESSQTLGQGAVCTVETTYWWETARPLGRSS